MMMCKYLPRRFPYYLAYLGSTILQAGGLLRALDSGPALKDIPPKVEEIADDSAERQSKTAVLENDPFRFLLEERNDKAEEHQSTCTTHGSVDVESDSTEECPQVSFSIYPSEESGF